MLHHSEPRFSVKRGRGLEDAKNSQLVANVEFVPVAVVTSGIIGPAGCSLLTDIGRCISRATMIPDGCLASLNRFQLPSSEATLWLLQPHQGNMLRSWLRDTDIQNGDALFCFIIMITVMYIKNYILIFSIITKKIE